MSLAYGLSTLLISSNKQLLLLLIFAIVSFISFSFISAFIFMISLLLTLGFTGECIKKLWYIYTMEYYSAIKRNTFESVLMRCMNLDPTTQSEVSHKEKGKYHILMHIYGIKKNGTEEFIYRAAMEKQT